MSKNMNMKKNSHCSCGVPRHIETCSSCSFGYIGVVDLNGVHTHPCPNCNGNGEVFICPKCRKHGIIFYERGLYGS